MVKVENSEKSGKLLDDQVRCAEFNGAISFAGFALVGKLLHFALVGF